MAISNYYIPTIGLEVHAQLALKSKMFSPEAALYGALPNTLISPISLAHPGTLPTINREAVTYAIKLGIACQSKITQLNYFARKNYFYPDLPKGYQITQDQTPICQGGNLIISAKKNCKERAIALERIHLEEDAGKSIHDLSETETLLDFNRAGVALLEIVTKPVINAAEEAYAFLTELRRLLRYLEICDGNMEEGSLRCDANVSVRAQDKEAFGQRVEIKNLNSIKNVQLAIEYEILRQIELLKANEPVKAETRSFDAELGKTMVQRSKEQALDYRYFIEPDLPPLLVTEAWIEEIKDNMPRLPRDYYAAFINHYQLSPYAADVLTESKEIAIFFEKTATFSSHYQAIAKWLMGPVKAYLNTINLPFSNFPISEAQLAALVDLVENDIVSFSVASQKLFTALLQDPTQKPLTLAKKLNLLQEKNEAALEMLIDKVLQQHPEKVEAYKNGKKGLLGMLMGEVMRLSQGKAAPQLTNELLRKKLERS